MPGIDPKVISHQLNISPEAKPVIQRPRRSANQHAEVVKEEVEKLLKADAIREI